MHSTPAPLLFATLVRSHEDHTDARRLIASLRAFGGGLSGSPFWVFEADPAAAPCLDLEAEQTRILPLETPAAVKPAFFGDKVYARSRAEALAPAGTRTLVWVDPACLILQPPTAFDLDGAADAAVRPVHIQNVGLAPEAPLDPFWAGIYAAAGLDEVRSTVDSFVDGRRLRAYFNSHAHAVAPQCGLFRAWYELFEKLACDRAFQAVACPDETHRIFLFQAAFSALLATRLDPARLRILPPTYNYPYQLQERIPAERRIERMNDLVLITYEDCDLSPEALAGMHADEPLHGWLAAQFEGGA
jgi:hypothetical protein